MGYQEDMAQAGRLIRDYDGTWDGISGESIARMRAQNKFRTGLDVARYTARIMRADMAAYDADSAKFTAIMMTACTSDALMALTASSTLSVLRS